MLKRKCLVVVTVLLLMIINTSCQYEPANPEINGISSYSFDENRHIKMQLAENLNMDAKVNVPPDIEKFDTYFVIPLQLNSYTQDIETMLLGDTTITHREESTSKGDMSFKTSDGKALSVAGMYVYYLTENFQPYIKQILFRYITPGDTTYDLSRFNQNKDNDLPFLPREQAEDEVKKALAPLGITTYSQVENYALDYKTMQTREKIMKDNGDLTSPKDGSTQLKDHWDAEDDMYYMILLDSISKVPVYPSPHGYVENNTHVDGTGIEAAYSQRGLEYLSIYSPYQEKSIAQEDVKIISVEKAIEVVKQKYETVILTDPTMIKAITLYYVPTLIDKTRDNFLMVPAWVFEINQSVKDASDQQTIIHTKIIIDATTGREIL